MLRKVMCLLVVAVLLGIGSAQGAYVIVSPYDTVAIPAGQVGSGNGTLDLQMFTFSGSNIENDKSIQGTLVFDGDDGNNTLPNVNSDGDTFFFEESYITTAGDLKAYYDLNFSPPGSITEIVLFLDLNETGEEGKLNTMLTRVDVILNPEPASILAPATLGDFSSSEQALINQVPEGGTLLATLQSPVNLAVNAMGAGFADYAIFTGIKPFDLNDTDVLLFNVSMSKLSNGAEDIFLSGTYSASDIRDPVPDVPTVPEPATLAIWSLLGVAGLALRRFKAA